MSSSHQNVTYTAVAGDEKQGTVQIQDQFEKVQKTSSARKTGSRTFLYLATCVANLAAFSCGTMFGWTSPVIPKLYSNDTSINPLPHPITEDADSWIGSLLPLGASFGPFIAGIAADQIGRKKTLLYSTAPFLLSFLLGALATNVTCLYLARAVAGLAVGGIFTVLPMYIGEIAEDEVRGALGSFMQLFIVVGILFSFCLGPYVSVSAFNYACLVAPTVFIVYFTLKIPESPQFLIAQDDEKGAQRSLMALRGARSESDIAIEFGKIRKSVKDSMENQASFMDIFKSPGLTKALTLSVGLVALQQLSGINIILFYTERIFEAANGIIPAAASSIVVGVVQVIASALTPIFADRSGKRVLLIISAIGMCVSEATLGFFFYLSSKNVDVSSFSWLPVLCLVLYIITYCVGFGPLPWAIMGELFPANIKSAASTVTAAGCWFLGFVLTKFFLLVANAIGIDASFYLFSAFCAFGVFFVYKFLPETSGKSLEEIQDILNGKSGGNKQDSTNC